MMRSCLAVLLLAMVAQLPVAEAKPKKYGHHSTKVHWKRENECARADCKAFNSDENDDCLAKCVSPACYDEIYAPEPLELGEIDKQRQSKFNACVRKEQDEELKRKAEERRGAAAARAGR